MPGQITFNYNWNKKLNNDAFTTIRLRNDKKFRVGETYYIDLNDKNRKISFGVAIIHDIKYFTIDKLNSFISYLDTGYNVDECKRIIETMYKNSVPPINWSTQELSLILLVKEK